MLENLNKLMMPVLEIVYIAVGVIILWQLVSKNFKGMLGSFGYIRRLFKTKKETEKLERWYSEE